MGFPFDECLEVLRNALTVSLDEHGPTIRELNRAESFGAATYDILPWDPYLGVGFRLESEPYDSTNSADWKHGRVISAWNSPTIAAAQDYLHRVYRGFRQGADCDGDSLQEAAHLIFLAGAQALLDPRIALQLQGLGVAAPIIGDTMPWHVFKFFVFDDDGAIKANYCDVLCANRAAQRLLGRTIT